ncbi:hypothetical protein SAMN04515647_3053 [Cohaesibacter sp. ES.047]|uniref:DUF2336 domain-containing protein n=1 Tax=Cohaesibacter sp. ES.047 TaxID=1798205 RepID=UPI000BC054D0|nr:DUF2336 domain-containing protein [Cohaesibacter sp. ES.047]SNY92785.1 hypothetical protein SAMN04515647_3053 [Cohaesibacter sp. ES.047]
MKSKEETRLIAITERFLAAGRFDSHACRAFSMAFHRQYSRTPVGERIRIAELLCRCDGVPLDVLTLLCCDNSKVAFPILSNSKRLSEADLTTQILQGTTEERRAIAQRADLNSVLISHLLSYSERPVARSLLDNHAIAARVSETQRKKMTRLAGDTNGQTGQQAMTTNKDRLDALVSSMEQDWAEHYQPAAEPELPKDASIATSTDDVPDPGASASVTDHEAALPGDDSFLDANDMAMLEQLAGEDWDQLDDDAIEALARSLAESDVHDVQPAQSEVIVEPSAEFADQVNQPAPLTEEAVAGAFFGLADQDLEALALSLAEEDVLELQLGETEPLHSSQTEIYEPTHYDAGDDDLEDWEGPRRMSFRIGVNDPENAPFPPLERLDPRTRAAAISFLGSQVDPLDEANPSEAPLSIPAPATASQPQPDIGLPEFSPELLNAQQMIEEHASSNLSLYAADIVQQDPAPHNETQSDRKAQITLTIRKRSGETKQTEELPSATAAARVELESATEDDWQQALSWLKREVVPYSKPNSKTATVSHASPDRSADPVKTAQEAVLRSAGAAPIVSATPDVDTIQMAPEPTIVMPSRALSDDKPNDISAAVQDDARQDGLMFGNALAEPDTLGQSAQFQEEPPYEIVVPTQRPETQGPLVHEHAPMGFMPDMVSFDGLELMEAEPDLPSVTDVLMEQHKQRAAPVVELVEPVDLAFIENGKVTAIDDMAVAPMQVIVEQLAAERVAHESKPVSETLAVNIEAESTLNQQAGIPMSEAPEAYESQTSEMIDLPAMAEHHLVDADEFSVLRSMEASHEAEPAASDESGSVTIHETRSVSLREITGSNLNAEGMADAFYAYDDESRLTLLQNIISETLVDAARLEHDRSARKMLDDEEARKLVMARFSNDRIALADMLHDLSGHRRLDMTRLLQDKGGEAMVVYLYHIGLDESGSLSMLLHGPDAVSHHYNKIAQLMTLYHQLYPAAASKIVTQLFGTGRAVASPAHETVYDDGAGDASPRMRRDGQATQTLHNGHHDIQQAPSFGRRVNFSD